MLLPLSYLEECRSLPHHHVAAALLRIQLDVPRSHHSGEGECLHTVARTVPKQGLKWSWLTQTTWLLPLRRTRRTAASMKIGMISYLDLLTQLMPRSTAYIEHHHHVHTSLLPLRERDCSLRESGRPGIR